MKHADIKISDDELNHLGLERVRGQVFLWEGYRYSNARDAVAAAISGTAK